MRKRLSLGTKIPLVIFALGLFFSLVISAGTAFFFQEILTDDLVEQSVLGAEDKSETLVRNFEHYDLFSAMLGTRTRVVEYLVDQSEERRAELQGIFDKYAAKYPEVLSIYLMDTTGYTHISTDRSFLGKNYGFREYFKKAVVGTPDVDAIVGVTSGEFGYYFSYPVQSLDGTVLGVLVIKISQDSFTDPIFHGWLAKDNTLMLVDERGVVVSSNRSDRFLQSLSPLSEAEKHAFSEGQYYAGLEIQPLQYVLVQDAIDQYAGPTSVRFYDEEDGETEELAIEKISDYPFYLVVEINVDRLKGIAFDLSLAIGAFVIAISLLMMVLAYRLVGHFLLRPLEQIFEVVRRITKGDFSARSDIRTNNEFEDLGRALNSMSATIEGYYDDLNKQVEQRTSELRIKNKEVEEQQKAIVNVLQDVQLEKDKVLGLASDLEKFKLAVDNASDHIVITDPEGMVLYGNKAVEKITGYSLQEAFGKKAGILWKKPMPLEFYQRLWNTIRVKKTVFSSELTNKRKNGELYDAEVSISPILDGNGNIKFFLGIERDISERKTAEKKIRSALAETEEKSQKLEAENAKDEALFANIGDGIVSTDNQGKIMMVNDSALRMIGFSRDEVMGRPFASVIRLLDEQRKPFAEGERPLDKALSTGMTARTQSGRAQYYVRKDSTMFPVSVIVTPFVLKKKIIGVIEVFRDVTFETQVDRMKTEFVSLASHQLRTPLSAINWYAEMLLSGDAGKLNPEQKKFIDIIYAGNQRMVDLVNSLLNVSRIEMGVFAVDPEPSSIKEISETVFDELQPQITEKNLKITRKYDPALGEINLDPKLFRIVVQNLLTNAVKYTAEKGTVVLTVTRRKDDVLLSISDNGYGIPKKDQDKIFTKMFRAENAREKDTTGTGLGLYIVKSIVEQTADGKIWFESEENKGTTFNVTIPLAGMKKKEGSKALS